jgi:hypothetical protein
MDRVLLLIKNGAKHCLKDLFDKLRDQIPEELTFQDPKGDDKKLALVRFSLLTLAIRKLKEKGFVAVEACGEQGVPGEGRSVRLLLPAPDERFAIDVDFKNLLPPLSAGELTELELQILTEGCRDPLIIWEHENRKLLADGHTRLEICLRHRRPYQLATLDLPSRAHVVDWIWSHHYGKRNFTPEAESYARGRRFNALKLRRGGDRRTGAAKSQNATLKRTAQRIAEWYVVDRATIFRDGRFARALDRIEEACGEGMQLKILSRQVCLTRGQVLWLASKEAREMRELVGELLEGKRVKFRSAANKRMIRLALPVGNPEAQARALLRVLGAKQATKLAEELARLLRPTKQGRLVALVHR